VKHAELQHRLRQIRKTFSQDPDIDVLYLFGSYATGTSTPLSDLDFAVLFSPHVIEHEYFQKRLQLITDLMSLTRVDAVELIVLNKAPLVVSYKAIAPHEIVIDNNSRRRIRFEVRVMQRYLDLRPFRRYHQQNLKERIASGEYFD